MSRCTSEVGRAGSTCAALLWLLCTGCGNGASARRPICPPLNAAPGVRWVGRIDQSDRAAPKFAWSGTGFVATVSGPAVSVKLKTEGSPEPVFFQPVIDGTPGTRFAIPNGEQTVALGSGLPDGNHLIEVYRESEGKFGDSVFDGFTDGMLQAPPASPDRYLEIVGDSISAGYGNLGREQHPNFGADPSGGCPFSTETESAYATYGAQAARRLGADFSIIALSGWGAYRDNSSSTQNVLASVYGNTLGVQATPAWSFERQADVVVVNLGTNDFAQGDPGEAAFKAALTALLTTIRGKNPNAVIYCMIGPLLYGTGLAQATSYLTAVVSERNATGDGRVKLLNFGPQNGSLGTGCSWHPNVTVNTAMADLLVTDVKATLGW
jgi:lysophospholipase L1-like esterase